MHNQGVHTDQLIELVIDALESPDTADTNALLLAATAFLEFLDAIPADHSDLIPHARALANAAADWAIFQRDQGPLRNAFRAVHAAYTAV